MPEPVRRAEGLPAGCATIDLNPWAPGAARELPGRRCPMFVQPPPRRSPVRRIADAFLSLGLTVAAGASLMVLAQYLTTP